jgi:PD-(D/E)XK endonuclease
MAGRDSGGDGAGDGKAVPESVQESVPESVRESVPEVESGAVPGFVPWIFAVADPDPSGWERGRGKREKRNPKRMGELSQAAFLVKAQSLGFGLALPWGDSERYDFIVWARPQGRLLRVQVKATGRLNRGGYDVQPVYSTRGEGKKTYTAADIDVLAAHVILEEHLDGRLEGLGGKEVWYLLPVGAFGGVKSLRFYPDLKSRRPRWERYREAWEWLGGSGQ